MTTQTITPTEHRTNHPLDLVAMYPDLFADLTPEQQRIEVEGWACQWHEGWQPNREDVADSIAVTTGMMSREEFSRRAGDRAKAARA